MKKPKAPKVAEADLVTYTQGLIQAYGIFGWRMNVGGIVRSIGGRIVHTPNVMKGFPDFQGYKKDGTGWALELKSSSGKLTVEQELWHERLKQYNVRVYIARTCGEIESFLRSIAGDVYP